MRCFSRDPLSISSDTIPACDEETYKHTDTLRQHQPCYTTTNRTCSNTDCPVTNPVSDFWQTSSCSSRCGRRCPSVSSPTQHWTTFRSSCAFCMIRSHALSIAWNRFASYTHQRTSPHIRCYSQNHSLKMVSESRFHSLYLHCSASAVIRSLCLCRPIVQTTVPTG